MLYSQPYSQPCFSRSLQNKPAEYTIGSRLPTPLYAPPEHFQSMYSNHPTEIDFEELMAGDIYSAALIFWEIANRVTSPNYTLALSAEINGKQINYGFITKINYLILARFAHITTEAQIDNRVMAEIHGIGIRPAKPVWSLIYDIMCESWSIDWRDRLTALRIFQNLQKVCETIHKRDLP